MGLLGELGEQLIRHELGGIGGSTAAMPSGSSAQSNASPSYGATPTAPDPQRNAIAGVMDLINHPSIGGIAGLASLFQSHGLGQVMNGWTSSGLNSSVSPSQVQQVLGSAPIAAFAQRLGIPQEQAASHLAQLLPHVVDHLTPDGSIPADGTSAQGGASAENVISELKAHLFG